MKNRPATINPAKTATLLLSIILAGCSSGSSNPAPTTPTPIPTPPPSGRYLFYQAGANGPLMAVDSVNPSNPQQITPAPIGVDAIGHANFDAATATVSDLHTRTIIYAEGGKLWRVSAFKADGLVKTQVSSETTATNICKTITATDLVNHNNAAYLYELAGPDAICATANDNLWRMVRVGMNSNIAPFNAKQPLTSLDEALHGAHQGWLVAEDKSLKYYSADFSISKPVKDRNNADVRYEQSISSYGPINILQEILRIDGIIGTYTVPDNKDGGNLWVPRASVETSYADNHTLRENGYLYFADHVLNTDTRRKIMLIMRNKLFVDNPGSEALINIEPFDIDNDQLTLKRTTNKLHLAVYLKNSNQTQIASLPKTGGDITRLTGGAVSGNPSSFIAKNDRLYYSLNQGTAYLTDGTNENYTTQNPPTPNLSNGAFTSTTSAWLGAIQPNHYIVGNTVQAETVFLAERFDATNGFAGGSLTRYDAATGVKGLLMGTIPVGIKEIQIEGNRTITLANGLRNDGHKDIFFVDIDSTASLIQITDDATDEIIIDAYH